MTSGSGPRARHVPRRTCIGCREGEGKRGLVRIVRSPDGHAAVDPTGRANGRGAYLHAIRECWEKALRGGTIERALRTPPSKQDVEALRAFAMALPAKESDTE